MGRSPGSRYTSIDRTPRFRVVLGALGTATMASDGGIHEIGVNSMMLLTTGVGATATLTAHGPWAHYEFQFSPRILEQYPHRALWGRSFGVPEMYTRSLMSVANAILNDGAQPEHRVRVHLRNAVEHLVTAAVTSALPRPHEAGVHEERTLFGEALRLIETRFREPGFSVADLQRSLGVSERTLHRTLAERGTTPRRQIEQRRVRAAEEILSGATVREPGWEDDIAASCGFRSRRQMHQALQRARRDDRQS